MVVRAQIKRVAATLELAGTIALQQRVNEPKSGAAPRVVRAVAPLAVTETLWRTARQANWAAGHRGKARLRVVPHAATLTNPDGSQVTVARQRSRVCVRVRTWTKVAQSHLADTCLETTFFSTSHTACPIIFFFSPSRKVLHLARSQ